MARHTKKNIRDYAITGFRNGRKVYLSQTFDTYTVTEYMGDRMLWQDLSEAKTVAVNPTVIKLFGYDGNIEEIPLDLPSDRYDITSTCPSRFDEIYSISGTAFPVAISINTTRSKTIGWHNVHRDGRLYMGRKSTWPFVKPLLTDLHVDSLPICEWPRMTHADQGRQCSMQMRIPCA